VHTNLVPVLAAFIRRDNRVLLAQWPTRKRHGGLWEFPGGKLAAGEDHLAAAKRELFEKLGLQVESVGAVLFERQDPGSEFLIQFIEVAAAGEPQALEHDAIASVPPSELLRYDLAPTDRAFVMNLLHHHA
jgi:8-oxo-dGTP diphosphatase